MEQYRRHHQARLKEFLSGDNRLKRSLSRQKAIQALQKLHHKSWHLTLKINRATMILLLARTLLTTAVVSRILFPVTTVQNRKATNHILITRKKRIITSLPLVTTSFTKTTMNQLVRSARTLKWLGHLNLIPEC